VRQPPTNGITLPIASSQAKSGYGISGIPCSPPVTSFHLKQIAQTICANASVSIAK
jgi:hypothetical protein